jgi:hypothetical protein
MHCAGRLPARGARVAGIDNPDAAMTPAWRVTPF